MDRPITRPVSRLAALALVVVAILATVPAIAAPTPQTTDCQTNCLRVASVEMYDYLQTEDVTAIVKIVDELGGGMRSAVIHGVWTLPDGTTLDQYAVTGTRLRGEFPLYSSQTGTFTFTVVGVTKTGYTFDSAGSAILSNSIVIGDPGGGGGSDICPANCLEVSAISMKTGRGTVKASITIVDEAGSAVPDTVVEGTWTLPDGATAQQSGIVNRRGTTSLSVPVTDSGTYTFTITDVVHTGDTYDPTAGATSGSITVD